MWYLNDRTLDGDAMWIVDDLKLLIDEVLRSFVYTAKSVDNRRRTEIM